MKTSLSKTVNSCEILVKSTDNPEISTKLLEFGYTPERLGEGKTMVESAKILINRQAVEKSEMHIANEEFFIKRDSFNEQFIKDTRLCKVAFSDSPDLSKIVPGYTRIYPYPKWYEVLSKFYANLKDLPKGSGKLQLFNFTSDKIDSRIAELEEVNDLNIIRIKEKGDSEAIIKERDEAIDKMIDYCNDLREIARIAFGNNSQILEKMGIMIRN